MRAPWKLFSILQISIPLRKAKGQEIKPTSGAAYFVLRNDPSLRGALATKQSSSCFVALWIASRSLPSGARSRDPLARNDVEGPIVVAMLGIATSDALASGVSN
jgi:hypothetical protein